MDKSDGWDRLLPGRLPTFPPCRAGALAKAGAKRPTGVFHGGMIPYLNGKANKITNTKDGPAGIHVKPGEGGDFHLNVFQARLADHLFQTAGQSRDITSLTCTRMSGAGHQARWRQLGNKSSK